MGVLAFMKRQFGMQDVPVPSRLESTVYERTVSDQQPRLSLQKLTIKQVSHALAQMTLGNCAPLGRIADAMLSTDPEIRAAVKQLKTAVCGVPLEVVAANESPNAQEQAAQLKIDLANPQLNLRALRGWIVEHRIRGIGLTEAIWNDPTEPHRTWVRFKPVPQERVRLNQYTGEPQFANDPFMYQGVDVSAFDKGKWIVTQPDEHIQDWADRGIVPTLLNDWYGRVSVMGWWQQALERDAMKTLVGKAASERDAEFMSKAFKNRGAAGAYLIRDEGSTITELQGTQNRSGISPYGEYMTKTAQRMFLALLGESQTGIIEQNAGSKASAGTQHEIARYVIEDVCNECAAIEMQYLVAPWSEINYGVENLVNAPTLEPRLQDPVDIIALNEAIAGRPENIELGPTWYRQKTQWPPPQKGETPLSKPVGAAFAAAEAKNAGSGAPPPVQGKP